MNFISKYLKPCSPTRPFLMIQMDPTQLYTYTDNDYLTSQNNPLSIDVFFDLKASFINGRGLYINNKYNISVLFTSAYQFTLFQNSHSTDLILISHPSIC